MPLNNNVHMDAGMIFHMVKNIGEGDFPVFSIYLTQNGDGLEIYDVQCGGCGAFKVSRSENSEEFNSIQGWVLVEGTSYLFQSYHHIHDGYPEINLHRAFQILTVGMKGVVVE